MGDNEVEEAALSSLHGEQIEESDENREVPRKGGEKGGRERWERQLSELRKKVALLEGVEAEAEVIREVEVEKLEKAFARSTPFDEVLSVKGWRFIHTWERKADIAYRGSSRSAVAYVNKTRTMPGL